MPSLREWHIGDAGGMQLFQDPDKAGSSTVTVFTEDLAAAQKRLVEEGLQAREPEVGHSLRLVRMTDPDGNMVILVQQLAD